ncbi:tRNA pseudouridine(55) synthase TruB, partial [Klebsiella pneumoniae]|nr:tRNA pseudouridine(55) synthase TruB [Klebsiella pneumoniae]
AAAQDPPAAQLLDSLLIPMDSPASHYPLVHTPETSPVYFNNGNPVRQSVSLLNGLVLVMEIDAVSFLSMEGINDEGRVAPLRVVV